jgi:hypothetical protein
MYDLEKKIIFTHFPKCGGTTIEAAFNWHPNLSQNKEPEYTEFFRKIKHASLTKHAVAIESLGYKLQDFFVFTCVRNPWDIMVSRFFHDKDPGTYRHAPPSLKEQVKHIASLPFDEYVRTILERAQHFLDIKPFIFHNRTNAVNAVIRFENYREDAENIFRKYGVTWPAENYNTHSRPKNSLYKNFYKNPQTKKIVQEAAESFIRYFDYNF